MRISGRLQNSSTYHIANEKIPNQTPAWYKRNERPNQSARAEETFEGFQIKLTKSRHILDHETNLPKRKWTGICTRVWLHCWGLTMPALDSLLRLVPFTQKQSDRKDCVWFILVPVKSSGHTDPSPNVHRMLHPNPYSLTIKTLTSFWGKSLH